MPADITGHALYDMKEGKFRVRKGPVFTNLLLADEINRAPAKTQAALLEVMQELHVTIEGQAQAVEDDAPILDANAVEDLRAAINSVVIDDACLDYAVRIVRETRASGGIRECRC